MEVPKFKLPTKPEKPSGNFRYKKYERKENNATNQTQQTENSPIKIADVTLSPFTPLESRPSTGNQSFMNKKSRPQTSKTGLGKKVSFFETQEDRNEALSKSSHSQERSFCLKDSHDILLYNKMKYRQKLRQSGVTTQATDASYNLPSHSDQPTLSSIDQNPKTEFRRRTRRRKTRLASEFDPDKIVLLERLGKDDQQIFKERHIKEVAHKIKLLMNRRDNPIANDVIRSISDKARARSFVANLGIAHKDYVKDFPAYAAMYEKHVETTVEDLTRKLKKQMFDRNILEMLMPREEEKVQVERPLLYSFGFKMDKFARERGMKSITQYLRKHDEEIWDAILRGPKEMLDYISSAGDYKVAEIFKKMEGNRPKTPIYLTESPEHSHQFITEPSMNKITTDNIFLKDYDEKKSNYLLRSTKRYIAKIHKQYQEKQNSRNSLNKSAFY